MTRKASWVLFFFLLLGISLAWDGCEFFSSWRCGDTCIHSKKAECKCGGEIFNLTAQMWCCNNKPCLGRGVRTSSVNSWFGEKDRDGRRIGAECSGTALKLEEPCNQKCNDYGEDPYRNTEGVLRSYVPCKLGEDVTQCITGWKTNIENRTNEPVIGPCNQNREEVTQCIPELRVHDRGVDCRNGADEDLDSTGVGNSSSFNLDLDNILSPCTTSRGLQGFNCSLSSNVDFGQSNCLWLSGWCNPFYTTHKCGELADTTLTGHTNDPLLCRNQTFWERRSCTYDDDMYRCTGDLPGLCAYKRGGVKCLDGSSEIKEAKGGECKKEELMCRARDGRSAGKNICVEKKFVCDNYLQCEDGEDEDNCEEEYVRKRVFPGNYDYRCKSPFLVTQKEANETEKFFPQRAKKCDGAPQCPTSDDETDCPPSSASATSSTVSVGVLAAVVLQVAAFFSKPSFKKSIDKD